MYNTLGSRTHFIILKSQQKLFWQSAVSNANNTIIHHNQETPNCDGFVIAATTRRRTAFSKWNKRRNSRCLFSYFMSFNSRLMSVYFCHLQVIEVMYRKCGAFFSLQPRPNYWLHTSRGICHGSIFRSRQHFNLRMAGEVKREKTKNTQCKTVYKRYVVSMDWKKRIRATARHLYPNLFTTTSFSRFAMCHQILVRGESCQQQPEVFFRLRIAPRNDVRPQWVRKSLSIRTWRVCGGLLGARAWEISLTISFLLRATSSGATSFNNNNNNNNLAVFEWSFFWQMCRALFLSFQFCTCCI